MLLTFYATAACLTAYQSGEHSNTMLLHAYMYNMPHLCAIALGNYVRMLQGL